MNHQYLSSKNLFHESQYCVNDWIWSYQSRSSNIPSTDILLLAIVLHLDVTHWHLRSKRHRQPRHSQLWGTLRVFVQPKPASHCAFLAFSGDGRGPTSSSHGFKVGNHGEYFGHCNHSWLVVWLPFLAFSQKYWVSNHPN